MFEALIITMREGIEVALIIGIMATYLKKVGKSRLLPVIFSALVTAILASIGGGFLLQRLPLNEETVEGTLYLVAALFVTSMMVWMWRTSREFKQKLEGTLSHLTQDSLWTRLGLFGLTFFLVFREGAETVLFLSAVTLSRDSMLAFFGALFGLSLAVLFGIFIFRGIVKVQIQKFFYVTTVVLSIFVLQLLASAAHEFAEVGIIPMSAQLMGLIGPIVKNNTLFIMALVLLPLLLLIAPQKKEALAENLSSAEKRRAIAFVRNSKRWQRNTLILGALTLFLLGFNFVQSQQGQEIDPPIIVTAQNGVVTIPVSAISENLHRYGAPIGGTLVRFLVLKVEDKIATALDACAICGDTGYIQEGKNLVCLNCSADILSLTLGESGGCHPIPLASRVEGNNLLISEADLSTETSRFPEAHVPQVVDPVCHMKLKLTQAQSSEVFNNKVFYFCSMPECHKNFIDKPEKFSR